MLYVPGLKKAHPCPCSIVNQALKKYKEKIVYKRSAYNGFHRYGPRRSKHNHTQECDIFSESGILTTNRRMPQVSVI